MIGNHGEIEVCRLDGLTEEAGRPVVEEIKSTALDAARLVTTTLEDWPAFRARFDLPDDADGEAAEAAFDYAINRLQYQHHAVTGRWLLDVDDGAAGMEHRLAALAVIRESYGPRNAIRWQEALIMRERVQRIWSDL